MLNSRKWNTLAASTASAPACTAGAKCSTRPAPPLAITGTVTAPRTARSIARSNPALVPSASIEFSRISPTPSSAPRAAQSTASIPVPRRPPCVVTSQPDGVGSPSAGTVLASTESTMHCEPNCRDSSDNSSGRAIAAVFTDTLSAPARSNTSTSATERTPPPTVSGMNTCSAVRRTTSSIVARPDDEAVTSRNVNSSAPSASYTAANSTGSPASRRFSKLTPLTTRPSSTSRQGMTRVATSLLVLTGNPPERLRRARCRASPHAPPGPRPTPTATTRSTVGRPDR